MLCRCTLYFGFCLLLCLSGCKNFPDTSDPLWWSPLPVAEVESQVEYDESGRPILPKVSYDPEYEEAADRQRLIRLLEKNNRLLEKIANE